MKSLLSKREEQVLKLLLAEYSQNEICEVLELSYSRVNDVKMIIMKKWGVGTMIGLVLESIRQGYLEVEKDRFDDNSEYGQLMNEEIMSAFVPRQAS